MEDLIIAIYQMTVLSGQKEKNLEKIQQAVKKYHAEEIDLWILPELFNTGFAYSKFSQLAEKLQESATLAFLGELIEEYDTSFCGSLLCKTDNFNKYQNVGFIFTPQGLIYSYPKIHLWITERDHFTAGRKLTPPVDFQGKANIGLSICYDLRFPEIARKLVLQGAEILITPAAWPVSRIHHFNLLAQARALENTCFHIAVNRLGIEEEPKLTRYPGSSQIIDPWGEVLAGAGRFERVIKATLEASTLNLARELLPVLNDRKKTFFTS
ncbi:MAG: hypothetical protein GF308_03400 [Candidatus Heimdallarchaeota archaeon]|nr:hypothetical protein [Candidatus Heimdallarchaeota archaeon]